MTNCQLKSKIISNEIENCPECGKILIHSGRVTPTEPAYEVMICKCCGKDFRREEECNGK